MIDNSVYLKYTRIMNKPKMPAPIIDDRWSDGVDHEPESEELVRRIADMAFDHFDDALQLRVGGDGDNGETLAYIIDALIENGLVKITFPKK
jgi:hypothetical protein